MDGRKTTGKRCEMTNAMTTILKMTATALAALALVALISACSSSSGEGDDAATTGASDQVFDADAHGEGGVETVGDQLVVTMRTEEAKFVPDTATVKVGQIVRLRLDNHDAALHDYTVDEPEFVVLSADGALHEDHESVSAHDDEDDAAHDDDHDEAEAAHDDEGEPAHDDDHDEAVAQHDDDHESDPAAQVSLSPLHIAADANAHAELVFEATEPGEYVFYCSVPGHRELGREGKSIVEE
jgi:uncharacterized cupredoxin-like copper-binding protein